MDASLNGHIEGSNRIVKWVWYTGTDAIKEGEAVCYNTDYGTATSAAGRRHNEVERPTLSNNGAFAGVAARDYSAQSGGQFIEINAPGSRGVNVALGVDTVIGTGAITFIAGSAGSHRGRFYTGKFLGRGTAIPRQTVTALLESDMTGGTWSLATDGVTLTVASTTGISAGDTVVLVGGEVEDGGGSIVAGKYTVSSVTNATTLVLTSTAISGTAAAALKCSGFCYTGNPKCQADLLDGSESYGVEFISPINAGDTDATHMTGGVSYVCGTAALAADFDIAVAQASRPGDTKAFICLGTQGTNDVTLVFGTNGVQMDGSTALAEVTAIDAANDAWYGVFGGAKWHTTDVAGGATEG